MPTFPLTSKDPIELAWAAGLFEGEGCFYMQRNSAGFAVMPRIALKMTDEDVVRTFARIVGIHTVYHVIEKPPRKPTWKVTQGGTEGERIYMLLEPRLHQRRRSKWDELRRQRDLYEQAKPDIITAAHTRSGLTRRKRSSQSENLLTERG